MPTQVWNHRLDAVYKYSEYTALKQN